ncbi:MAG: hypothetical protein KJ000_30625 [Pirellulaceae bacterium]|nr:hypothetical protein [Pirellulaceae bacterium]
MSGEPVQNGGCENGTGSETQTPEPSPVPQGQKADREQPDPVSAHNRQRLAILLIIFAWTYLYNVLIKGMTPVRGFFEILDTISDDFVMGALLTIALGVAIVFVYSFTKLYTQIIANIYSFRIIEDLFFSDLKEGRYAVFFNKIIRFEEQPHPDTTCPTRVSSLLFSFSFIYVMSWIYLVLFSEALFFVSWSAGVDLPVDQGNLLLLPTLALAIPFSARVMAFVRYPYAQSYADFMPGAVFVLLVVAALGTLFESDDQKFFLATVFGSAENRLIFLRNGAFLAFVPVFFEACFWILELFREERRLGLISQPDTISAPVDAETE